MLFPRGKTKFYRPDGKIGMAPGHGVVLIGMGEVANGCARAVGAGLVRPLARLPRILPQRTTWSWTFCNDPKTGDAK
jgi:hypothetical protein